LLDLALKKK
jgi:hypothetical protein